MEISWGSPTKSWMFCVVMCMFHVCFSCSCFQSYAEVSKRETLISLLASFDDRWRRRDGFNAVLYGQEVNGERCLVFIMCLHNNVFLLVTGSTSQGFHEGHSCILPASDDLRWRDYISFWLETNSDILCSWYVCSLLCLADPMLCCYFLGIYAFERCIEHYDLTKNLCLAR